MNSFSAGALCLFLLGAGSVRAEVSYASILDANAVVTGVRSDSSTTDSVVLTASYVTGGITYAGLYEGSLAAAATSSTWHALTPVIANQTVSSATFYGPNTSLFEPGIPAGSVIAVGSYKYAQGSSGPNFDHGMLYEGPLDGSGTWTQIDATPLLAPGETLLNTIAHSNMGDLVVGNYDTSLATGKAFIYNRVTEEWTNLNPMGSASVTAYGIWQNGGSSSTSYTIAGGYSDVNSGGLDMGYLVDYNSTTHALTHFRSYNYKNLPLTAVVSHFDGITATADGFNLTGDAIVAGGGEEAFFASVKVDNDHAFSEAVWTQIAYPGSDATSGNTVVENKVLGIFVSGQATQSYIATVQPDRYGVAVSVSKGSSRATFTITNTGNTAGNFNLSRVLKVANSYAGPVPSQPGKSPLKITFSLGGANLTKALEKGTATTGSIPAGASVQLVEKVKASSTLAFKRTVQTTIQAVSAIDSSKSASAKVKLVVQPK